MIVLIDQLKQIVEAGGGLNLDLSKQMILSDDLIHLAALAGESGANLYIRLGNAVLTIETLIEISRAGRGSVVFEDLLG